MTPAEWGDFLRLMNILLCALAPLGMIYLAPQWALKSGEERLLAASIAGFMLVAAVGSFELYGSDLAPGFRVPMLTFTLLCVDIALVRASWRKMRHVRRYRSRRSAS